MAEVLPQSSKPRQKDVSESSTVANGSTYPREPLNLSGILDGFKQFDVTPVIGTEFQDVQLVDWMVGNNSDAILRDLAITISQRGVVFFRAQDSLTDDLQKQLVQRLGELTGKPVTSSLHIHPLHNFNCDEKDADPNLNLISTSESRRLPENIANNYHTRKQSTLLGWHSDISYEPVPSDYVALRLTQLPRTGGDTLWASSCEVYDRISAPYQRFLESLTAVYRQPRYRQTALEKNFALHEGPRGAPENVGTHLRTEHPVVRTNPVTGWKSLYAVGNHIECVNGLTGPESKALIDWFFRLIVDNHDLQVRHRWQNVNDVAIWDNRSAFHTPTFDFEGLGHRTGHRAVGIGERPYLDPNSKTRRQDLAETLP